MTTFKLSQVFPCAAFFNEGRVFLGFVALLMQASLIFWPIAARWARQMNERSGVEKLLAELSETHRVPVDQYAQAPKKFRQLT